MMRWALAFLLVTRGFLSAGSMHAQDACDDLNQQVASAQQQVDQDRADADELLQQVAPLAAIAPAQLLEAASQGNLPGVTPDVAASFGAIVNQIGAQVTAWEIAHGSLASTDYLRDLLNQLAGWEGQFAALTPVQAYVPSLVQFGALLSLLEQNVGSAQGDLAMLDDLNATLQQCQANAAAPAPTAQPAGGPPEGGPPADQGGALCSVGGTQGTSASQCFQLENDAAFAVWEACTEQYFAAEQEAFRTGGDLPVNTCDPAWKAQQQAISERWGIPVAP